MKTPTKLTATAFSVVVAFVLQNLGALAQPVVPHGYVTAVLRSETTSVTFGPPPVGAIEVGRDFVIMGLAHPDVVDLETARQLATDAVFHSLMPLYCAVVGGGTNRVQWSVEIYDAAQNPKISACAASGCEFHYFSGPCSVTAPEQITFLMTWVNVDIIGGALERGGNVLLATLSKAFVYATNQQSERAIRELQVFINKVDALVHSGDLSQPAAETLKTGAAAAIMELENLPEGNQGSPEPES